MTCSGLGPSSQRLSLHEQLREATREIHERLHRHPGFAAVLDRTIDLPAYRALLCRLLGFHLSFELASRITSGRSRWLKEDLRALGLEDRQLAAISCCPYVPDLDKAGRLGALYVIEGSALGGRLLAARLDRLLGPGVVEGRRFFLGRESESGAAWREFLAQLESESADEFARRQVIAAAVETFSAFENWLADWEEGRDAPV